MGETTARLRATWLPLRTTSSTLSTCVLSTRGEQRKQKKLIERKRKLNTATPAAARVRLSSKNINRPLAYYDTKAKTQEEQRRARRPANGWVAAAASMGPVRLVRCTEEGAGYTRNYALFFQPLFFLSHKLLSSSVLFLFSSVCCCLGTRYTLVAVHPKLAAAAAAAARLLLLLREHTNPTATACPRAQKATAMRVPSPERESFFWCSKPLSHSLQHNPFSDSGSHVTLGLLAAKRAGATLYRTARSRIYGARSHNASVCTFCLSAASLQASPRFLSSRLQLRF